MIVDELGRLWLNELLRSDAVAPRTLDSYEYNWRTRISPFLGEERLADLSVERLRRFYEQVRNSRMVRGARASQADGRTPLSHKTVRQARVVLHAALTMAVSRGWLPMNPVGLARLRVPTSEKRRYKVVVFSRAELEAIRVANIDLYWGPLWTFLGFTGLRIGEALALTWEKVDLEARTVLVDCSVGRVRCREDGAPTRTRLALGSTKTVSSQRTVPLSKVAHAALVEQRRQVAAIGSGSGRALVFPNASGTYQDTGSLSRRFAAAQRRAFGHGWSCRGIHALRHTFASLLIAQGVAPKVIAEIMGHHSTQVTMDIYGHLYTGMTRDAVATLDDDSSPSPSAGAGGLGPSAPRDRQPAGRDNVVDLASYRRRVPG